MDEQNKFIEMIEDVTTLAKLNKREVTVEFLNDYFKELNLDDSQMQLVYKYLSEHNIKVAGYEGKMAKSPDKESEAISFSEKDESESEYLDIYLDEVNSAGEVSISLELFKKMAAGDEAAKEAIVNAYLPKVISFAKGYRSHGLSQSDLIQEGNIGLLLGLSEINADEDIKNIENILDNFIKDAMLQAIDELSEQRKNSNNIVRKADMVREKAEELADIMNDKMTIEEIADYMEMDLSEVEDILRITGEEL